MAKSQHTFQKRRRELEKKKKRQAKIQKKMDKREDTPASYEDMIENAENLQPVKDEHDLYPERNEDEEEDKKKKD